MIYVICPCKKCISWWHKRPSLKNWSENQAYLSQIWCLDGLDNRRVVQNGLNWLLRNITWEETEIIIFFCSGYFLKVQRRLKLLPGFWAAIGVLGAKNVGMLNTWPKLKTPLWVVGLDVVGPWVDKPPPPKNDEIEFTNPPDWAELGEGSFLWFRLENLIQYLLFNQIEIEILKFLGEKIGKLFTCCLWGDLAF